MAKSKQSRKLRILTLALSIAMILSFCAFGFAACADNDTSDDETTEESTTKKTETSSFSMTPTRPISSGPPKTGQALRTATTAA